jgi:hypothetical protein
MTNRDIKPPPDQQSAKDFPRSANSDRISYAHLAQIEHFDSGSFKFFVQPTFEAKSKMRFHFCAKMAVSCQSNENRFDASVQVATMDVKNFQEQRSENFELRMSKCEIFKQWIKKRCALDELLIPKRDAGGDSGPARVCYSHTLVF